MIVHHKKYFSRIYPKGLRFGSSNYDPIPGGAQIVALNFQTEDINLLLNLSKFEENGGVKCGYVLKPDCLLDQSEETFIKNKTVTHEFIFTIISGQQLHCPEGRSKKKEMSKDIADPFVRITLRGHPFDEKQNKTISTPFVNDNGFSPKFKNFTCKYTLKYCPLDIFVFEVYDYEKLGDHIRLGWYGISADCIREGYRVIPLRDDNLLINNDSYLLVHTKIIKNK